MDLKQQQKLIRYSFYSGFFFVLMNIPPTLFFIKGYEINSSDLFFIIISFGFLIFSLVFFKLYEYQVEQDKEKEANKIKTNNIAAKRLSSLIQDEKELQKLEEKQVEETTHHNLLVN